MKVIFILLVAGMTSLKTSGYRVSPAEIEEVVYSSALVTEVAAIGVPHSRLGQAIVLVVVNISNDQINKSALISHCQQCLPYLYGTFTHYSTISLYQKPKW